MRQFLFATSALLLIASSAQAGHLGLGGFGFGGGWHGGFHGFGWGGLDAERMQTRFENKFEDLMADYDTGLTDIDDFFNSDEYQAIVESMERFVDRYDFFLIGVERTIDRLGDFIEMSTEDVTYLTDLIAEYEAREDLSAERIDRIVSRLTTIQDHLTTKIDVLTEKQTTLSGNLSSYELYSSDLDAYLAAIVAAGGGTTDSAATAAEILAASTALAATAVGDDMSHCEAPQLAQAATAVAEPSACVLFAIAMSSLASVATVARRWKSAHRTTLWRAWLHS